MDSGPVKPARRWPLLPTRRAGEPATAPVSPTDHVNPAVPDAPPGDVDSHGRRHKRDPHPEDSPGEQGAGSGNPEHLIDRSV